MSCQHCNWVQEDYRNANKRIPRLGKPFYVCKPDKITDGASVFNSTNRFFYTFNVVYGVKNDWRIHSTNGLQKLLICVTRFIEYLNTTYGFNQIRVLVNSDLKRGKKEHIHAMVTMNSAEDEKKFISSFGSDTAYQTIADHPYDGDIVYNISSGEAKEMIRDKAEAILTSKLGVRNLDKTNFYLFLRYDHAGKSVSGVVSTPSG